MLFKSGFPETCRKTLNATSIFKTLEVGLRWRHFLKACGDFLFEGLLPAGLSRSSISNRKAWELVPSGGTPWDTRRVLGT